MLSCLTPQGDITLSDPTTDERLASDARANFEPCDQVKYLMRIGGFATFDEYMEWYRLPLDDWEEPDWQEIALREMGCFESGSGDDDDPEVLAYMQRYAESYVEEKESRLIRIAIAAAPSHPPQIPIQKKVHRSRRWCS